MKNLAILTMIFAGVASAQSAGTASTQCPAGSKLVEVLRGSWQCTPQASSGKSASALPAALPTSVILASRTSATGYELAAWGDSLIAGGANQTGLQGPLATLLGRPVYNGGVGGQTCAQISARMLAATDKKGRFVIIWAGVNDSGNNFATVPACIAGMVASLEQPTRFLVISLLPNSAWVGTSAFTAMQATNAALKAAYPNNYYDALGYLLTQGTGTGQDQIDAAGGMTPTSLRADAIHPTTATNVLLANQVAAWIIAQDTLQLGAVPVSSISDIFASPPALGGNVPQSATHTRMNVLSGGTWDYGTDPATGGTGTGIAIGTNIVPAYHTLTLASNLLAMGAGGFTPTDPIDIRSFGVISIGQSSGYANVLSAGPGNTILKGAAIYLQAPAGTNMLGIGTVRVCVGQSSCSVSGTGQFANKGNTIRFADAARTPASSSEACNAGEAFFDATYLYVCTATNTIKRLTLTAF